MSLLKLLSWAMLAGLSSAAASAAELNARDRAAIDALEQRVVPLPGPRGAGGVATLAERMAQTKVPAVSVAFIEDGQVKWARAYGEALAGSGRKATPETRFQAASMSKAVAAAGALRLVDQGRLSLDEDVNKRLKAWRVPAAASPSGEVTLRQLLSHTAGLTVDGYPGYAAGTAVPTIVQSLSGAAPANTAAVRSFAAPGAQMAYSGGSYSVVQLLMTEAASSRFPQLMERLVLRPARMHRSGFHQPLSKAERAGAASGHTADGAPIAGGGNIYPELAAAGLWTTPSDYARFLIALQDSWIGKPGALLKPETARAMMTPVLSGYGLGVTVVERDGRRAITHGGSNEGFRCVFLAFLDESRQGLVIMTNGDEGGRLAAGLQRTIAQAYGWNDTSGPPPPRAPAS